MEVQRRSTIGTRKKQWEHLLVPCLRWNRCLQHIHEWMHSPEGIHDASARITEFDMLPRFRSPFVASGTAIAQVVRLIIVCGQTASLNSHRSIDCIRASRRFAQTNASSRPFDLAVASNPKATRFSSPSCATITDGWRHGR